MHFYASRRSRTRDTVKLTVKCVCVCVYSSCNCSTVAMHATKTNSFYRLLATFSLDFDLWIYKLKLCSRVMATLTYSEGCCCLFRILCRIICPHGIICPHKLSIQPTYDLALHQSACYLLAKRVKKKSSKFFTARKQSIGELQPLAQ